MAFTLSRYLRLRIDSNLTANAKYNLERIDQLGLMISTDTTNRLNIRSQNDVTIEPESADVDGSGIGGTVSIGSPSHQITELYVNAASVNFSQAPGLFDQAVGGSKYLRLKYQSDLNGLVDTGADRSLVVDLDGADRNLILGANLSILGSSLSLTSPVPLAFTLPSGYGSSNDVLTSDGAGELSWSSQAGGGNVSGASGTWLSANGTSKTITHGLNSMEVDVSILDDSTGEIIGVDSISTVDSNSISLTASEAPAVSWTVVVQAR